MQGSRTLRVVTCGIGGSSTLSQGGREDQMKKLSHLLPVLCLPPSPSGRCSSRKVGGVGTSLLGHALGLPESKGHAPAPRRALVRAHQASGPCSSSAWLWHELHQLPVGCCGPKAHALQQMCDFPFPEWSENGLVSGRSPSRAGVLFKSHDPGNLVHYE
ncbi:hypothetical protein H8959_000937 [Pygathrix nigripes]